jgi:translation initiation factor IF-2
MARTIEIQDSITVGTLAERLQLPVTRLIGELMKNGVMATVNEQLDFDTAQIIVSELGLDVELSRGEEKEPATQSRTAKRQYREEDHAEIRPPVVAVMGHVDHGKTTLLDALRGAHVASGEAGGITQHISAYQIDHNGRPITFLDTPGHEAFAAIREHGAQLTDLVILVVAADDGVKPQTLEAIRYARQAGVKLVVAINKIDKDGANPDMVKGQLAEQGVTPDDKIWRGDVPTLEISAKNKQGIDELLDMILLVADVEDLRAPLDVPADGLIIESYMAKGRGPVAHGLVESGVLRPGSFVVAGGTYARVRNLETRDGKKLAEAGPSTPVVMTGFKDLPGFGDEFQAAPNEKAARQQASQTVSSAHQAASSHANMNSSELIRMINRTNQVTEFNIILKADVQGSLTSVMDSLHALDTEEVAVRIVSSGIGAITESDVQLASTTGAVIYGFNVSLPSTMRRSLARHSVKARFYEVIYELIDDVRDQLSELLRPEEKVTELGQLRVKAVFKTTKSDIICGGEVLKGKLSVPALATITRGDETLVENAEVTNLKRGPQDVKEVLEGEMCGLSLRTPTRALLQEGDRITVFTRETITRHL